MLGLRFGRLVVVERRPGHSRGDGHALWLCQCDCGNQSVVRSHHLRTGTIKSCGCGQGGKTHGCSKAYVVWCNIQQRCCNPTNPAFKWYGGRGLKLGYPNFEAFFAEMGDPPPGYHIHRKVNDRGYEPGNCEWLPRSEHMRLHNRLRKG